MHRRQVTRPKYPHVAKVLRDHLDSLRHLGSPLTTADVITLKRQIEEYEQDGSISPADAASLRVLVSQGRNMYARRYPR
jgi:hypothetical protein